MKSYDCVVVGGGPAGITAALYLLRSGATIAFVEKLSPGGQTLQTDIIENYPGFPKGIKGYELADTFAAHLDGFTFDRYSDEVRSMASVDSSPRAVRIQVGDEWLTAKSVILASGCQYRTLNLPREKELTGRGVSYCALCDGNFFRNQVVGVVGGGNSALEEAMYLAKLVKKLYLIHRRDSFRAARVCQDKLLKQPNIEIVYSSVVKELLGEDRLTGVRIENGKTGERTELPLDGLFIFIGFTPASGFIMPEAIRDEAGFIVTDAEMRTNVPGVFAAGDVRSKLCRQVVTAVGDGATAANSAYLYLEQL